MEKSTRNELLIGVGILALIGFYLYKKKSSAATKTASTILKGATTIADKVVNPKTPDTPENPIIDPKTGKLVKKPKQNPNIIDTDGLSHVGKIIGGTGKIDGSAMPSGDGATNTPDASSGRLKKNDPNAKDENWIKANEKRLKKQKEEQTQTQVDCLLNPYDPSCLTNPNQYNYNNNNYNYNYNNDNKNTYGYSGSATGGSVGAVGAAVGGNPSDFYYTY